MFNKITKNLIILGVIIFSFAVVNNVYAARYSDGFTGYSRTGFYNRETPSDSYDQEYSRYDYGQQQVSSSSSSAQGGTNPTVVNNYYYSTTPKTSTTSNTTSSTTSNSTVKNNTVTQGDKTNVPNANIVARSGGSANYLGASAYNGSNFAASAGSNNSDGFMPNTVGEWILTIILILAIVIISRIIARKAKENKALAKTA